MEGVYYGLFEQFTKNEKEIQSVEKTNPLKSMILKGFSRFKSSMRILLLGYILFGSDPLK